MVLNVLATLSPERFGTYLFAVGHNQKRAMELYLWNAKMGEAFHTPIQAVEIALRNKINHALVATFGPNWWETSQFRRILDPERIKDLDLVQKRIANRQLPLVTGQIVAGLSLGFWVGILRARYNPSIWSRCLRAAFPSLPTTETRSSLEKSASNVAELRNRISQHEPIFKRDLLQSYGEMMRLLKWICSATHDWIRPHCRVPELVRNKP